MSQAASRRTLYMRSESKKWRLLPTLLHDDRIPLPISGGRGEGTWNGRKEEEGGGSGAPQIWRAPLRSRRPPPLLFLSLLTLSRSSFRFIFSPFLLLAAHFCAFFWLCECGLTRTVVVNREAGSGGDALGHMSACCTVCGGRAGTGAVLNPFVVIFLCEVSTCCMSACLSAVCCPLPL